MNKLNRWLSVSNEDASYEADDVTVVDTDTNDLDQEIEAVEEELDDASIEMEDAAEAHEALEAYADLVRSASAREDINTVTARAIYIGLESYGIKTAILPSVESFGSLSVSIELLDKLKDGAKYVKEKIVELYKKIKELIARIIDWFKKDTEADKEKVKELEANVSEMVEAKNATEKPKLLTISEVKRIEQEPIKETSKSSEAVKRAGKELVIAGERNNFVYVENASFLHRDGKETIFDVDVMRNSIKESDTIITKMLDMLNDNVDALFSKTVNNGEEARDVIFELFKKYGITPGGIAKAGESEDVRMRDTARFGLGSFSVICDIDLNRSSSAPAGAYLKMSLDAIELKSMRKTYYTPPTRQKVGSLIGLFSELSSNVPYSLTEEPSIIEDLKGATDENAVAKMNFINRNYVTLQAQYLRYRKRAVSQFYVAINKAIGN